MSSRKIYIVGEINDEAYQKFSEEVTALELKSKTKWIDIELSSGGGFAYSALAFASRMRTSPCSFRVTAYGFVASAAVLILVSGNDRRMTSESWVMVHEDDLDLDGSVSKVENEVTHHRMMEDQWNDLMERATGHSEDVWAEMHKATTYMTAKGCLDLNMIDEIL